MKCQASRAVAEGADLGDCQMNAAADARGYNVFLFVHEKHVRYESRFVTAIPLRGVRS